MVRQLFKGGNYSKEESINYLKLLTAETIQRRKVFKEENIRGNTVFKEGNYSRKESGHGNTVIPKTYLKRQFFKTWSINHQ